MTQLESSLIKNSTSYQCSPLQDYTGLQPWPEALYWTGGDYPSTSESTIQDTVLPWLDSTHVTGTFTGKKWQDLSLCNTKSGIKSNSDWDLILCLMSCYVC